MRLYVNTYQIQASNHAFPVREMGMSRPTGFLTGYTEYQVNCSFTPIPDEGETTQEMLEKLSQWVNGTEINMVKAAEEKHPRCFYCGVINDTGKPKCQYCGGEMR